MHIFYNSKVLYALIYNAYRTFYSGAAGGTRTHTPLLVTDFESASSTNSNTAAYQFCLLILTSFTNFVKSFFIFYLWYVSLLAILNPLNICSNRKTLINWCGNVIFEKHIFSFAVFSTSSPIPKVPPITNVIELL